MFALWKVFLCIIWSHARLVLQRQDLFVHFHVCSSHAHLSGIPVPSSHTEGYFDAKQSSEDPLQAAGYVEVQATPTPSFAGTAAVVTQGHIVPKATKNRVQVHFQAMELLQMHFSV